MIRKEHLNTEATIKTAGWLYYLVALFLLKIALAPILDADSPQGRLNIPFCLTIALLATAYAVVGTGLLRLKPWARIPAFFCSTLGLIATLLGTVINVLIIVNLARKKGKFVMSPEYQEIIAATPHVKRRLISKPLLIILLILLALLACTVIFSKSAS